LTCPIRLLECIKNCSNIHVWNIRKIFLPSWNKIDRLISNYNGAATHVNVFRARTTRNETWNLAYFLSCGSLDGDELVRQIILVTPCCELVGLLVQCLISDAGGGNAGAL